MGDSENAEYSCITGNRTEKTGGGGDESGGAYGRPAGKAGARNEKAG